MARDVLKHGLIWQVGNDTSIQIYNDNWIPRPLTFRVYSPRVNSISVVSDLLTPSGSWNDNLIQRCFSPEEAELITSIVVGGSAY